MNSRLLIKSVWALCLLWMCQACGVENIAESDGASGGGNGVPATTPFQKVEVEHDGTSEDPFTINEFLSLNETEVPTSPCWVQGYVVGSVDRSIKTGCLFGSEQAVTSNLLLATDSLEQRPSFCVPVELKSGSTYRTQLNLVEHPDNMGRYMLLEAKPSTYFSVRGLKSLSNYEWVEHPALLTSPKVCIPLKEGVVFRGQGR